jgi:hypothetical protein
MVDEDQKQTQASSDGGCLVRGFWMLLGNAMMAVYLVYIAQGDGPLYSFFSLGFWIVLGLVLYARYMDVTRFAGTTSEGDRPATMVDVKRFSKIQVAIAGTAWVVVHAI